MRPRVECFFSAEHDEAAYTPDGLILSKAWRDYANRVGSGMTLLIAGTLRPGAV